MTRTQELVPFDGVVDEYVGVVTPLKTGGRRDVEVTKAPAVRSFQGEMIGAWRRFFDQLDKEVDGRVGDPVALATGLANAEALLADVRYVRDRIKGECAKALQAAKVRRLTISDVTTVEGVGSIERTGWQHERLLREMLEATDHALLDRRTGEVLSAPLAATRLLEWMTPAWKLTPIREAGLDPHDFCDVATDDGGKAVSTPSVKIVDNTVRKLRS